MPGLSNCAESSASLQQPNFALSPDLCVWRSTKMALFVPNDLSAFTSISEYIRDVFDVSVPNVPPSNEKARAQPGLFSDTRMIDQTADLNSFDALALIGSAVSAATFWDSSASSLL